MSLTSHLDELRRKHRSLSELIEREQRQPGRDELDLKDLKRRKLHLKDEIHRLSARL